VKDYLFANERHNEKSEAEDNVSPSVISVLAVRINLISHKRYREKKDEKNVFLCDLCASVRKNLFSQKRHREKKERKREKD